MEITVTSKAGLVGYLQGSMKGIVSILEATPEEVRTGSEQRIIDYLKNALVESDEIWEKVKANTY